MKRFITFTFVIVALIVSAFTSSSSAFSFTPTPEKQKSFMSLVYLGNAGVSNEEEIRNILFTAIDKQMAERKDFRNYDNQKAQQLFDDFLLNNDQNPDDTELGRGYIPKRDDLNAMAKTAGVDYVLFVNTKITDQKIKTAWLGFSPFKYEVTALYNVLVYSVNDNRYVYNKKYIVKENAAGTSSSERAFKKATQKFVNKEFTLKEVTLDSTASAKSNTEKNTTADIIK